MKYIFNGEFFPAATDLDVRGILCATVELAIKELDTQLAPQLQTLLNYLEHDVGRFPEFSQVNHQDLKARASVIRWEDHLSKEEEEEDADAAAAAPLSTIRVNCVLRLMMPCHESELLWMPWMPHQTKPTRNPATYFHPIVIAGRSAIQARATKCYDHAYAYSGQTHPIEPETPAEITKLYQETNAIFGLPQDGIGGVNMCLENDFANGRQFISEHSDDERGFGSVHDVFCYVTGPASREGVFRVRKSGGRGGDALEQLCCDPHNAARTRELVRIRIPAGLYVMRGRAFQQRYTHEFPQCHEHLFRRICNAEASVQKHRRGRILPGFPADVRLASSGASQKTLLQATWIQQHRDLVLKKIGEGAFGTTTRHRLQTTPQQDREAFEEWCLWRTSYTLRNFEVGTTTNPAKRIKSSA